MKGWQKAVIAAVAIAGGTGIGYAFYKRQQNIGLFAEFRKHGDINGDGVIDDKDLALLKAAWQATPTDANWNPNADLNYDGIVNALDLAILSSNFGLTYAQWLKTKGYAKPQNMALPRHAQNYTVQTTNVPIKEI